MSIMPPLPRAIPAPPLGGLLRLPARVIPRGIHSRGLALLLNRLLHDALSNGEIDFLENRVLQVEVTDLGLDYRLTLERGVLTAASAARTPDVRFGGRFHEFLVLALNQEDPDTLFFQRRLQLEGDTELGLEIKNFLYSLDDNLLPTPLHSLASRLVKLTGPAD